MRVPSWLFSSLLPLSAWSTRDRVRSALVGRPLMRTFGAATLWLRGGRRKDSLEAIAREWQRMFPDSHAHPLTRVDDDTIQGEIRVHCPYRGTGNVEGCYRMMEYDRRMMERIGGEFVVLRSQAEPGVTSCQVAIRRAGSPTGDLVPAHVRASARSG
ncbi:MAG TPA: hypothetical protein VGK30_05700 [Candidatus Binatia bacterium]